MNNKVWLGLNGTDDDEYSLYNYLFWLHSHNFLQSRFLHMQACKHVDVRVCFVSFTTGSGFQEILKVLVCINGYEFEASWGWGWGG